MNCKPSSLHVKPSHTSGSYQVIGALYHDKQGMVSYSLAEEREVWGITEVLHKRCSQSLLQGVHRYCPQLDEL